MISKTPPPGTLPFDVLRLICEMPGELPASVIAERLFPLPEAKPIPPRLPYLERVKLFEAASRERKLIRAAQAAKVSRTVRRLQEAGLVEPAALLVAEWFTEKCVLRQSEEDPSGIIGALAGFGLGRAHDWTGHAKLVLMVAESPTLAMRAVAKNGCQQKRYEELVARGIFESPQRRRPTAAGLAWVASVVAVATREALAACEALGVFEKKS